jgi:hypothetical protein
VKSWEGASVRKTLSACECVFRFPYCKPWWLVSCICWLRVPLCCKDPSHCHVHSVWLSVKVGRCCSRKICVCCDFLVLTSVGVLAALALLGACKGHHMASLVQKI